LLRLQQRRKRGLRWSKKGWGRASSNVTLEDVDQGMQRLHLTFMDLNLA
jgi:hypothetical protein